MQWSDVTIPHDWAIDGPFDKKWDLRTTAIVQDGETKLTENLGQSGALPWIGKGFYKTMVVLTTVPQHALLCFDGAMSEPTIYVNGQKAGSWAYGYNAFQMDITSFLRVGDNEISVHLNNVEESTRWYPGAGLYRPVQLILNNNVRIQDWSTFIYTQSLVDNNATLSLNACVLNATKNSVLESK